MSEVIRNEFKAFGVFKCHHPAHRHFGYNISPYHVLDIKKCYPGGCVEFIWRCHSFEKGQPCHRGYQHVGRDCYSCKQYHESKIDYAPESSFENHKLTNFVDRYHQFRGWLEDMRGKLVAFSGRIDAVSPHLEMYLESKHSSVELDGYYLTFTEGDFSGYHFASRLYLKLSASAIERLRPAESDIIECEAFFTESRGRVILQKPRKIEITKNGGQVNLNISRALVGRATGKVIIGPVAKCHGCPFISLVDIEDNRRRTATRYRRYFCLRGIEDSETCPIRLAGLLEKDQSPESI